MIQTIASASSPNVSQGEIDSRESISSEEFLQDYIRKCKPLVLTGMMQDWPAMSKWSLEYFRELNLEESVHLEEGNVMQDETAFKTQRFKDYIEQLIHPTDSGHDKTYLSVFKLFSYFPELKKDIDFEILDQHKTKSTTVGWIGPAGTVTGYHIDWGDNILAQIHGRKRLHLASPDSTSNMYVSKKFDQGTAISEVDLNDWDSESHPNFAKVTNHQIILEPGHMIFIPRGWWHHVESLDKSISVSNIAYSRKDILFDLVPQRIKQVLHDIGIWRCPCTCHVEVNGKRVRK